MSKPFTPPYIFFWLTLVVGVLLLYPTISLQGPMSTGDHGRDLYAFNRTLHGDLPYQDYWWVYGPLMPYYYAVFDHVLGINIPSILTGKALLTLTSGLLVFLTLETLVGGLAGFAGAAWFFTFGHDFFFTYNHAGGITFICCIMFCVARYITTLKDDWLWLGLTGAFILSLIKVNFGLAAIPLLLFCAFLTSRAYGIRTDGRRQFFYWFAAILLPVLIAAVYWLLLYGLTWNEVQQCLPFARNDAVYQSDPGQAMKLFLTVFWGNLLTSRTDFVLAVLVLGSLLRVLYKLADTAMSLDDRKHCLLIIILFGAYFMLNFHEYLRSGLWYRTFWIQPTGIVWMFALIALAVNKYIPFTRFLVFGSLIVLAGFQAKDNLALARRLHITEQYLYDPLAKAFVSNSPEWIKTVEDTTAYLKNTVPADETFFALPYDNLYYYLTNKTSPTRMLIFFDHLHISPEQEHKILSEIEKDRVNFILLSNRMYSQEMDLGRFGQTYCPVIAKYIDANFTPVAQFGEWQTEPGWGWNHGTRIYQRKGIRQ